MSKPQTPPSLDQVLGSLHALVTSKDDQIANLKEMLAGEASEKEDLKRAHADLESQVESCAEAYAHVLAGDLGGAREAMERALDNYAQIEGMAAMPRIRAINEARAKQAVLPLGGAQ